MSRLFPNEVEPVCTWADPWKEGEPKHFNHPEAGITSVNLDYTRVIVECPICKYQWMTSLYRMKSRD